MFSDFHNARVDPERCQRGKRNDLTVSSKRTGAELWEVSDMLLDSPGNTLVHLVKQMNMKEEYAVFLKLFWFWLGKMLLKDLSASLCLV